MLELDTDIEFSFDGDYFRVSYDAKSNNKQSCIHRADFLKQDGLYCFSTITYIDVNETSKESLEELHSIVAEIEDPFDLESFKIEIDECFEDQWSVTIDCWEDSLDALPKMKQINKLVKKIFKKAGATLKE
ncbi:MAG: hypothetical protein NWF00_03690 [Candidatus Bathyarchaeota archaeon]|nr:hypothetical protein [Candidatus Bathyarchaeota archaeon]